MPRKKKTTSLIDEDFLPEEDQVISPDVLKLDATNFAENQGEDHNVSIKKAKIKEELFLYVEYTEELPGHGTKTAKLNCTVPIHEDLKEAFDKLTIHLSYLCDEIDIDHLGIEMESRSFSDFGVRSFSIGGSGENEGVVVSGWKDGRWGMVNLNTPFTKYENEDYPYISELAAAIDMCIYEVKQYLFHGKRAPDQQLELEFPEQEDPQQAMRDIHEAAEAGGDE